MQKPDGPAILMGDLNDRIGSDTLRKFETTWKRSEMKELSTFPVDRPVSQIDFIMVRPETRWTGIETRVLDDAIASDHRAIFAILELEKGQPGKP